jgi:hypothetical protein
MLEIDWDAEKGWSVPKITPYHFLSISPAASSLHYGIEVRFVNVLATVTLDGLYSGVASEMSCSLRCASCLE